MKRRNRFFVLIRFAISVVFFAALGAIGVRASLAAGSSVSVYAEGAYTDTDLAVYVYADIPNPVVLVSMGIRVNYDSTKLSVQSMEKNEDVWYFGTPSNKFPYRDPEDTGNGVIIIGGKLDTNSPAAGVTGNRVLLGKVTFTRLDSNDPGSGPEGYFGITVGLGKGGTYANFVDTDGNELDENGVDFSNVIVRERGDANGDKIIDVSDILRVKSLVGATEFPVYVDCNGDEQVDVQDILCTRSKL